MGTDWNARIVKQSVESQHCIQSQLQETCEFLAGAVQAKPRHPNRGQSEPGYVDARARDDGRQVRVGGEKLRIVVKVEEARAGIENQEPYQR